MAAAPPSSVPTHQLLHTLTVCPLTLQVHECCGVWLGRLNKVLIKEHCYGGGGGGGIILPVGTEGKVLGQVALGVLHAGRTNGEALACSAVGVSDVASRLAAHAQPIVNGAAGSVASAVSELAVAEGWCGPGLKAVPVSNADLEVKSKGDLHNLGKLLARRGVVAKTEGGSLALFLLPHNTSGDVVQVPRMGGSEPHFSESDRHAEQGGFQLVGVAGTALPPAAEVAAEAVRQVHRKNGAPQLAPPCGCLSAAAAPRPSPST